MRFLEALKTIRNKFIRKNPQTQPEDAQRVPEEMKVPEKEKAAEATEKQTHRRGDEKDRKTKPALRRTGCMNMLA